MKLPKTRKKYCPYCKKHTEHKITLTKKKSPRSMSYGSKVRARLRGRARGTGNLGRYSKPAVTSWKMTGKKVTKKTDLRYTCTKCNKMHNQRYGIRAKRVEFK
ncbi:MAG: large subunit ribosomal protein L44e [archaeon GW2011_AR3]|nr:MAG: large subunit ribosomal protein L44e [archaeon GW2011_AR3]MBS3109670.1 50S ribosomal protein L44e [Candidatus Woesearchaeota archaeon]